MKRGFCQLFRRNALWCCRDRTPFVSLHGFYAIRSIDLSLRACQGLAADFRRKSETRTSAPWGRKAGTDRVREGIPEGFRPTEQALRALEARKRQALSHPTYFFCGSSNFSPFLNTA